MPVITKHMGTTQHIYSPLMQKTSSVSNIWVMRLDRCSVEPCQKPNKRTSIPNTGASSFVMKLVVVYSLILSRQLPDRKSSLSWFGSSVWTPWGEHLPSNISDLDFRLCVHGSFCPVYGQVKTCTLVSLRSLTFSHSPWTEITTAITIQF